MVAEKEMSMPENSSFLKIAFPFDPAHSASLDHLIWNYGAGQAVLYCQRTVDGQVHPLTKADAHAMRLFPIQLIERIDNLTRNQYQLESLEAFLSRVYQEDASLSRAGKSILRMPTSGITDLVLMNTVCKQLGSNAFVIPSTEYGTLIVSDQNDFRDVERMMLKLNERRSNGFRIDPLRCFHFTGGYRDSPETGFEDAHVWWTDPSLFYPSNEDAIPVRIKDLYFQRDLMIIRFRNTDSEFQNFVSQFIHALSDGLKENCPDIKLVPDLHFSDADEYSGTVQSGTWMLNVYDKNLTPFFRLDLDNACSEVWKGHNSLVDTMVKKYVRDIAREFEAVKEKPVPHLKWTPEMESFADQFLDAVSELLPDYSLESGVHEVREHDDLHFEAWIRNTDGSDEVRFNFSEMFKDAADDAHKKENGFEIDKELISRLASRASDIAAVEFDRGSSRVSQVLTHGNRR